MSAPRYTQLPRICRHARERMREMGLSTGMVEQVVLDAEQSWTGDVNGAERTTYQRGEIAVVVQHRGDYGPFVVTVLHRTQETYTRKAC